MANPDGNVEQQGSSSSNLVVAGDSSLQLIGSAASDDTMAVRSHPAIGYAPHAYGPVTRRQTTMQIDQTAQQQIVVKQEVATTDAYMSPDAVPAFVTGDSSSRQSRRRVLPPSEPAPERDHREAEIESLRHQLRQTADQAERSILEQRINLIAQARSAIAEQRHVFENVARLHEDAAARGRREALHEGESVASDRILPQLQSAQQTTAQVQQQATHQQYALILEEKEIQRMRVAQGRLEARLEEMQQLQQSSQDQFWKEEYQFARQKGHASERYEQLMTLAEQERRANETKSQ